VPKGEEIASLSYNYVLRVRTPTGAFELVAVSPKIKQVYLVKPMHFPLLFSKSAIISVAIATKATRFLIPFKKADGNKYFSNLKSKI